MDEDNLAQSLFSAIAKASKAIRRPGQVAGGVNFTRDLINKRITGTFVFPLDEEINEETGEVTHKIADSLVIEEPVTTNV